MSQQVLIRGARVALVVFCAALVGVTSQPAKAATLCVNPSGSSGCLSTIGAAVSAAKANDTIKVAPGTYKEDVVIGKPLSLIATNPNTAVIDATGLANGIYVDGIDNPGLMNVTVSGFRVVGARFEGILVANASSVTIWNNHVLENNTSLDASIPACPDIPPFETNEGFDCGEGIHLTGVHQSIVANNVVQRNAGGILLSDDTGPTYDNLISGNIVSDNPFDCGITLASHPPASITNSLSPLGVFHNTISGNQSSNNGRAVEGAGAGVGIFDSIPGTMNYGNVVINNQLRGNGLPGVALHSHAPHQNLNDNVIVGNQISGNAADTEDAATPGSTGINVFGVSPITGTLISQNVITDEDVDVAVKTPGEVEIHLNNLQTKSVGVANLGTGAVDATLNWWGCSGGPGETGCATVSGPDVLFTPWLTSPFTGL
jgi:parallel beta-helix repeat protein